ncbi:MAG: hypothetical protein IT349_03440 [Candidatus Eisenbacteria bacterium]|nr:hypothetical protein [Candidatus Eisenbacteria bacterium]MCC7141134.1 hypothetical protein [Candidatus Eisenbacteria bacterium]
MSRELLTYITPAETELAEHLAREIRRVAPQHYDQIDDAVLQQRTARLVGALVKALETGPEPFLVYVRQMAEARIHEGFFLEEMQTVLSLLEERLWNLVLDSAPYRRGIAHLAVVTTIVGRAKDELARVYLERERVAEVRIDELEHRLQLLRGTDPVVEAGV